MKKTVINIIGIIPVLATAQTVNTGELSVRPGTEVSTYFDFHNRESGRVLNDGHIYFYDDYNNEGLFGYTLDTSTGYVIFEGKQAGETITYTFDVINAGDMTIHDIEIEDPLFGFNIKLDETSHEPIPEGVTFEGDINNNGVLDVNETWTFTVKYTVTNEDIYQNEGVYNQATVTGVGKIGNSEFTVDEDSVPTEDNKQIEGRDPDLPNHTFVPLEGNGLIITNPMIRQKTK